LKANGREFNWATGGERLVRQDMTPRLRLTKALHQVNSGQQLRKMSATENHMRLNRTQPMHRSSGQEAALYQIIRTTI
jgi:hypothetical protein